MTAEWQIVWFTAWVSALSTLVILPFGVAIAWLLARHDWPGKSVVETIVTLPLVMPPVATGLILLKVLGRRGVIGRFFYERLHIDIAFTWRAVLAALAVMSFPLLVRSARVAFEQVNPRFEQIARTLGRRGMARVFFHQRSAGGAGHHRRGDPGFRAGAGRIRRDDHGGRKHSGKNGDASPFHLSGGATRRQLGGLWVAWHFGGAGVRRGLDQRMVSAQAAGIGLMKLQLKNIFCRWRNFRLNSTSNWRARSPPFSARPAREKRRCWI